LLFPRIALKNPGYSVPEYFEGYSTVPRSNFVLKELTQAIAWHKDWLLLIS